VCIDVIQYTVEQRAVLYELYVKCSSAGKSRRKFRHKYPGITVPSTTDIQKLINKVRSAGSLMDKKPAEKAVCLPKKKIRRNEGLFRIHHRNH
jgi:hypothetical protein